MNRPRTNRKPATRRCRSLLPNVEEVEKRQLLSGTPLFVLGSNGNLWLEAPGWQTNGRTLVDSNVKSFTPSDLGEVYVLGTNGNLWLEGPDWQTTGRTWIDSNVRSFALVDEDDPLATTGEGQLYVEGTDGNLWLEGPGWQTTGRTWIDGDVQAFAGDPFNPSDLYVQRTDGNLWLEAPGWQLFGRTWVDSNVQSFVYDPFKSGFLYVEASGGNLWLEAPGWQFLGRTWVDSNVQSFAYSTTSVNELYVENTNGNLWLEAPGWQFLGRTWVDSSVQHFSADISVGSHLYVEGTDGNLWLEAPGWQTNGRTWVDGNVQAIGQMAAVNPFALGPYSPAPAGTPLFNKGGPSYLDVDQGDLGDCWLLASLAEVAARDPQIIENMFTYDGTTVDNGATVGLYTVRFYTTALCPVYVQVDTELPSGGDSDNVSNDLGTSALWVALAEKAYVVANDLGCVTSSDDYGDTYSALAGGYASWALQAITGKPAADFDFSNFGPLVITAAWNAGDLVVLGTDSPSSSDILSSHAYALVGYNASSSMPFEVFNPWGTDSSGWAPGHANTIYGLFWANASLISNNFVGQSLGFGGTGVATPGEPANSLTESATLDDGQATSSTIKPIEHGSNGNELYTETAAGTTRPAQATAIGAVPGDTGDISDDDNTTARDVNSPAGPLVVSSTGPTFIRTRSFNRTAWKRV